MTLLTDLQHQDLINEIRDRGFTVLDQDEVNEIKGDLQTGERIINMICGLSASIACRSDDLTIRLIEQLLFLATGEETELEIVALAA